MSNADGLHPLSKPIATVLATGIGSATGAIVGLHLGHPTAGSAATAGVAGAVAFIGGTDTIAWGIDPLVRGLIRFLAGPSATAYQR
jgi:hypothetical protein